MAVTAEQQKLTEILLVNVEATPFPKEADLDRIERLLSSREELEVYIAILTEKVAAKMAPHGPTLDRLERLIGLLQSLDQDTE